MRTKKPAGLGVVQRVAASPSLSRSLCPWSPKPRKGVHGLNTFSFNLDNNLSGRGVFSKEAMRAHQSSSCSPSLLPRLPLGDGQGPGGSQTTAEPGNPGNSSVSFLLCASYLFTMYFLPTFLKAAALPTLQNLLSPTSYWVSAAHDRAIWGMVHGLCEGICVRALLLAPLNMTCYRTCVSTYGKAGCQAGCGGLGTTGCSAVL